MQVAKELRVLRSHAGSKDASKSKTRNSPGASVLSHVSQTASRGETRSVKELVNDIYSDNKSDKIVLDVLSTLLEEIDHPTSLGLWLCVKYGDLASVVSHSVSPHEYNCKEDYQNARQATDFARKYPFNIPGIDREAQAFKTFQECEESCELSNIRAVLWRRKQVDYGQEFSLAIEEASVLIAEALGEFCPSQWLSMMRFGPGASASVKGTSLYDKFNSTPSVTAEFEPYAWSLISQAPAWADCFTYDESDEKELTVAVIPGEKYGQVPKDALTNRNIGTQPLLNGFAQLGIGSMMRRRLKAVGIDLDNGQAHNQNLARIGSLTGKLCTVDLKNASDSIASQWVRILFQYADRGWLRAMQISRCSFVYNGTGKQFLHRFSSMGNGFTFELESLIFWALVKAIAKPRNERELAIYGDDLIFPTKHFDRVKDVFDILGFVVNERKSFRASCFRESCGADFWAGHSVRPFLLTERVSNVAKLISVANGLNRRGHGHLCGGYGHGRFVSTVLRTQRWIPAKVRRLIAEGYTQDDSILGSPVPKLGKKLVFKTEYIPLNYYPARAGILFNLSRKRETEDPFRVEIGNSIRMEYTREGAFISGKSDAARVQALVFKRVVDDASPKQVGDGHVHNTERDRGHYTLQALTIWDRIGLTA